VEARIANPGAESAKRLRISTVPQRDGAVELGEAGGIEKSISTRNPERANGMAAAVIDRTSTGKVSRDPRSPPFPINDQNVSPSI
jgi:hypothetical protein